MTKALIPAMSSGPFQASPTGLTITQKDVPLEAWLAYGEGLKRVEGAIQWVMGDWLNFGQAKYGETYTQAMELWPEAEYQTLAQYKRIAKDIEFSTRVLNLSWAHHREVASMEPADQKRWLTKAEAKKWTVRDLRKEIARARQADGKTLEALIEKCADKTDQERFELLGWGLRTYDLWNFNACDERFGQDWPGRIPAQLVAHALFFFTKQGATIVDPMAGGGVVQDVCSVFRRDCLAFDMDPSRDTIKQHFFEPGRAKWPTPRKADMIFWDAPYYTKMASEYGSGLSSLDRKGYLAAVGEILGLARSHLHRGGVLAFLNSDWRAFQSTQALDEDASLAVTMFDYARLIESSGYTITHRIECPMSNARFSPGIVSQMQSSRILGTVNRTLLVTRV